MPHASPLSALVSRTRPWGVASLGLLGVLLLAPGAPPRADVDRVEPEATAPDIAAAVSMVMLTGHYSTRDIDDDLSRRWYDVYLDRWDPQRLYFTAEDVERFATWRDRLDDDIRRPKPGLAFAYDVFDTYRKRVDERTAFALAELASPPTFDDPERVATLDRTDAPWLPAGEARDAVWRDRVATELLQLTLSQVGGDEDDASETDRKTPAERLKARYERNHHFIVEEMEAEDVLEAYLGAFTASFDPHSAWMRPATKANFDIEMSDTLTGIGAQLRFIDGYTTIEELIAGGPAELSGELQKGDKILAVAQEGEEPVDIVDMRLDKVVQLIRGEMDTVVTLTIHPADARDPAETREIDLVRDKVKLADAATKGEIRDVKTDLGPVQVGYLDVPSFYVDSDAKEAGDTAYGSTANDTARFLRQWKGEVDVVVVDLRFNGGGSLEQALELTGLFLDRGPVVQVRDRDGRIDHLDDPSRGAVWDGPVVVLTSEGSASASEIFAAALQDHGRALVVGGTTTHGKGTVQNLTALGRHLARLGRRDAAERGGAVKYTTHMFYRVNGESTQVRGVLPDIQLPSPFEGIDMLEADLDNPLPFHRIAPARYTPVDLGLDLDALRARSEARVRASMGFAFLLEDLRERERLEARDTLSLHLPTRRAEIDRNRQIDDARETAWRLAGVAEDEDPPDPVLEEALQIAADVVRDLREA